MAIEPFILPLHYTGPTLTPEDLFFIAFWVLTLPMFVATVGVFLSRRIDLDIEVSDWVKLILPLLYVGLFWGMWFSSWDMLRVIADFISSLINHGIWYGYEFTAAIVLIPSILGFLQARLSYPDEDRLYTVVFVVVVVALWALVANLYENTAGFGSSGVMSVPILSIIEWSRMVLAASPIAYLFFLTYIYRWSSDSGRFFDSVLMPCLLVTVIYSPLFLLSFVMFV